ncbi:MAG: undecaprenyl/decaprenyl-phosphate alpha-N-acetylglucosaminyl 1-phosphate transferase [Candidatus Moranbacteria bacterium]|nr:undecaprenyl/decaprenyl-phosphate alpha-N-acetylglucosaminyl 1-phosphate transferase [Candidatus Moranbacteria bacterium]
MENNIFLTPFLVAFFLALLFLGTIVWVVKNGFVSISGGRLSSRHIHDKKISRFGGLAIILSFILTLFFDKNLMISSQLAGVLIASLAILAVGIFDDIWQLSWKKQLFFQIITALFVFFIGIRLEYISNPLGGVFFFTGDVGFVLNLILVVFWILLISNAMNWVDGVDGVSGGISAIGFLTIFFVSIRPEVNQPPLGIVAMALLGSVLAFVIFNFNPAKILAGTSGSFFMGFILAMLALFAGAKIATTLLVLAVPVIDALWVIFERLGSGERIFEADKKHLHYRLLELGWSQRKICLFYWLVTALIASIALNVGAFGKLAIFFIIFTLMIVFYFLIRKKTASTV